MDRIFPIPSYFLYGSSILVKCLLGGRSRFLKIALEFKELLEPTTFHDAKGPLSGSYFCGPSQHPLISYVSLVQ